MSTKIMTAVIEKIDITDQARAAGWQLDGVTVVARLMSDPHQEDPREAGDVYNADVDEADYKHPTHGFCLHCAQWMHKLTQDEANAYNATLPDDAPLDSTAEAGHWLTNGGTITCPARDGEGGREEHQLDQPLAVRSWRADEWAFGIVEVTVTDDQGHVWGRDSLAGVEYGRYPHTIDRETGAVEYKDVNPLTDPHHPLPDMISEALGQAVEALAKPRPTIVAPAEAHAGSQP